VAQAIVCSIQVWPKSTVTFPKKSSMTMRNSTMAVTPLLRFFSIVHFLIVALRLHLSSGVRIMHTELDMQKDSEAVFGMEEKNNASLAGSVEKDRYVWAVEQVFHVRDTSHPSFAQVQLLATVITQATDEGYTLLKDYAAGKASPFAAFSVEATEKPAVRTAMLSLQRRYQWEHALQSGSGLRSAVAGYIIEDYVTYVMRSYAGVHSQHVDDGARPDFYIEVNGLKGVVDITSSNQVGHVLDKQFNWQAYSYVSEALYPQINFNNIRAGPSKLSGMELELISKAKLLRAATKFNEMWNRIRFLLRWRKDQGFMKVAGTSMGELAGVALRHVEEVKAQKGVQGAPGDELRVEAADGSIRAVNELVDHFGNKYNRRRQVDASGHIKLIKTVFHEVKDLYGLTDVDMAQVWDMWGKHVV